MSSKSKTKTLHIGKKQIQKNIEDELIEWTLMNRSLGITVPSWKVTNKACSLNKNL